MPDQPLSATQPSTDPLEVALVYSVRSCRSCSFFWPAAGQPQTYGPYPAFDLPTNAPDVMDPPPPGPPSFPWLQTTTRPPAFPDPEVIDGCRKAPIMTIGINPNLTA